MDSSGTWRIFSACAARSANFGARLFATAMASSAVSTGAERMDLSGVDITRRFMVMSLSIDLEVDRIKRCCSANKKSIALHATKRQIRHHLRNFDFTDELSILSVTDDTFGTAGP